jgi:hypothetical protein
MQKNVCPRNVTCLVALLWVINIIVFEVLIFRFQERSSLDSYRNIFIVSDPQLTDNYSYGFIKFSPNGIISQLVYFFSDLYMKKNFASILARNRNNIHAIVFQGDLMDSGRFQNDETWQWEYDRYKYVFKQHDNIPTFNVSGNHDIGFGDRSDNVVKRFKKHFGKDLNYEFNIENVRFAVINSLYLEFINFIPFENDANEMGDMKKYQAETWSFLEKIAKKKKPTVLFSHVPLFRPNDADCGVYAKTRKQPIRQGIGFGYQNLLSHGVTQRILRTLKPQRVFSGDDHENCEHVHKLDNFQSIENTVGSFSFLQGTIHPSYGMISVKGEEIKYRSVFLPTQWYIYIWYIICAAFTLPIILVEKANDCLTNRQNFDDYGKREDLPDIEVGIDRAATSFVNVNKGIYERKKAPVEKYQAIEPTEGVIKKTSNMSCCSACWGCYGQFFKGIAFITMCTFGTFFCTLLYWSSF